MVGPIRNKPRGGLDKYGWSYYTREWVDEWYPGYGSSWPLYTDAVGILYEQAGTDGCEGGDAARPLGTEKGERGPRIKQRRRPRTGS